MNRERRKEKKRKEKKEKKREEERESEKNRSNSSTSRYMCICHDEKPNDGARLVRRRPITVSQNCPRVPEG